MLIFSNFIFQWDGRIDKDVQEIENTLKLVFEHSWGCWFTSLHSKFPVFMIPTSGPVCWIPVVCWYTTHLHAVWCMCMCTCMCVSVCLCECIRVVSVVWQHNYHDHEQDCFGYEVLLKRLVFTSSIVLHQIQNLDFWYIFCHFWRSS